MELPTGDQPRLLRDAVVARSRRMDAGRAGGSAQRGQGRAVPRVLVALARSGADARTADWTQMSTLPAQNFITLPSPVKGTHYGLGFAAGGRLRSDFVIDLGSPEASAAQFEVIQSQRELVESIYDATAVVGAAARPRRLPHRRLQRGRDHVGRGLRVLHRLDDRCAGAAAPGHRGCPARRPARGRRTSTAAEAGHSRHDLLSFQTAKGAKTTTSPTSTGATAPGSTTRGARGAARRPDRP